MLGDELKNKQGIIDTAIAHKVNTINYVSFVLPGRPTIIFSKPK